jgi:hypothetical protein
MEQEIGKQYSKDKVRDKSGFLESARLLQSTFRANTLDVPYETFGNYLIKSDAEKGLNFQKDSFTEVQARFPEYDKPLFANMLNNQAIGFNFFTQLKNDFDFARIVLNEFLNTKIESIEKIEFAYTPSPSNRYLDDDTNFNVYIEYTDILKKKSILGVTLNYTENGHKLKSGSKEALALKNEKSRYSLVTKNCGIFETESTNLLQADHYRQLWKTQLLGERILFKDSESFSRFTSLVISPEGNVVFTRTCSEYANLLINSKDKFKQISFEKFITSCLENSTTEDTNQWVTYLSDRYLTKG